MVTYIETSSPLKNARTTPVIQMRNSSGERRAYLATALGSASRLLTAWIINAASAAFGIKKNTPVRTYNARTNTIALNKPASGVRTPVLESTPEAPKAPVPGYPPTKGAMMLEAPWARISCEGQTL